MGTGKLTISIDLELAWGVWDILSAADLQMAETSERPICAALIDLFDRHQVRATWAIVAALLDKSAAIGRPGKEACWYAPDIIERVVNSRVAHELGTHSGRHVYFNKISESEAGEDLAFAEAMHRANGFSFKSMVFPRNAVAHLGVLARHDLKTFRGPDAGWVRRAGRAGRRAAQVANYADKFFPVPPSPVTAKDRGDLIDIPGSMLLMGRNGPRRFVLPQVTRAKLYMGLERARHTEGIFHLWFHPSNFYYRRDEQLATLSWFLEHAANEASRGRIEICTMESYAASAMTDDVSQRETSI